MVKEDIYKSIKDMSEHIRKALRLTENFKVEGKFNHIFICGMGGSAIVGDLLQSYLDINIPVTVNRRYTLSKTLTRDSLVFFISYSGNTEETIAAFKVAIRIGCRIVAITSGGILKDLALRSKVPVVRIPLDVQPRAALGYLFFAVLNILRNSRLIPNPREEIYSTINAVSNQRIEEKAERFAEKLKDKIPIIYSSDRLKGVALRWKEQFNENAKIHAFCNIFPEIDHNEIEGYENLNGDYHVIMINDQDDYFRIKKRMELTKQIILKKGVGVTELDLTGRSFLARMMVAIVMGDYASYHLAKLIDTDPNSVTLIENLKKKLGGVM
ncbi:bifunctional phosphoglucose/phosphomannose isomerase [Candidatus Woesearchaeota archaeon]|nr:MAG: bifunctional phosphoglucose/phosphomannose isomerase [Candidatus Woesearchaeota archaeon]